MRSLAILFLAIVAAPSFGQLPERTGLTQHFTIETGGYDFEVSITSNFNIQQLEFNAEEKKLTMQLNSNLDNNLAEIQIPINLINGNFTFFLDNKEIFPTVQMSDKISFITLDFEGDGSHTLDIMGTTYLPEFAHIVSFVLLSTLGCVLIMSKTRRFLFNNYS